MHYVCKYPAIIPEKFLESEDRNPWSPESTMAKSHAIWIATTTDGSVIESQDFHDSNMESADQNSEPLKAHLRFQGHGLLLHHLILVLVAPSKVGQSHDHKEPVI